MECTKVLERSRKPETLAKLEGDEKYALLLHIRHCLLCKETLTIEEYVKAIRLVLENK